MISDTLETSSCTLHTRNYAATLTITVDNKLELRTPRLLLRAAILDDAPFLHECLSDDLTMQYWSCAPYKTVDQTIGFLQRMIGDEFNGYLDFIVCLLPDPPESSNSAAETKMPIVAQPLVIGKAGIYDGKEIGFIFNKRHWGKGYAFEALDAIIKHFWMYPGGRMEAGCTPATSCAQASDSVETIKADVDPRNEASLKLLKKLGFVEIGYEERTFYTHLGWCDSVYLELQRCQSKEN